MSTLDEDDVDAIARRVVELLAPMLGADPRPQPTDEPRPGGDTNKLLAWIDRNHPDITARLAPTPEAWSEAIADATTGADPVEVLEWAWSPNCPTRYWREQHRPMPAPTPRQSRRQSDTPTRRFRYGPWQQLLAEHRLHLAGRDDDLAAVDELIAAIAGAVTAAGTRSAVTTVSSRKNALTILGDAGVDPRTVLEIVQWCLAEKPHWRSNLTGVPKPSTFQAMRGDWTAAGQGFRLTSITDEHRREHVAELAKGWSWYMSNALGHDVATTPRTLQRLHDLLAGDDTFQGTDHADVQAVIRWICDRQSGRTRYYTDSTDFPRPDRARKAILDMRSGPALGDGVTTTNAAAGDLAGDNADDELRGAL